MFRTILLSILIAAAIFSSGCDEKTGIIKPPPPPYSYVTPTLQNLVVETQILSKCVGGILKLNCEWTSPHAVSTATAFVGFVRTIKDPKTEPIGVIASGTEEAEDLLVRRFQLVSPDCIATNTAEFYARFVDPIEIPSRIGTDEIAGKWVAEIPFTPSDLRGAPLGIHQMMIYKTINRMKTNTLSFEITIKE